MIKQLIKETPIYKLIVECICFLIAILGIAVSIKMNITGRSLWYDESALAYSFVKRSFVELTATTLDNVQSAPVGWLYVLKIFCKIFGYTDFVMRVPAILAYIGVLVLLFLVSRNILKIYYPMVPVAFCASLPLILQYSNIFKPYIYDAFFALLILYLFYLYRVKKINVYVLGLIWAVVLWFSSPACFVEGGIIIGSFFANLLTKDKNKIKKSFFDSVKICLIIGISFVIYYIYWLRKVDDGMTGFWQDWKFTLIPTSIQDLKDLKRMIVTLADPFYYFAAVFVILFIVSLIIAIIKKNEYILSIHGTFLVSAFASFVGKYPVNKRLWLFIYPLVILAVFYVLDFVVDKSTEKSKNKNIRNAILGLCLVCICAYNGGIRYYVQTENVFWPGYEVKGEYNYLKEVIKDNDIVYVTSAARPMFQFYNKYDDEVLLDKGNTVLIGKENLSENYDTEKDFAYITSGKPCYIVMSDTWDDESCYGLMFRYLRERGNLEMVYNEYNTPLWLFTPFI